MADVVTTRVRRRARTVGRTRGGGEGRIRRAGLGATSLWQRSHLLVAGATLASATRGDLRQLLRCGGARLQLPRSLLVIFFKKLFLGTQLYISSDIRE